MTLSDLELKAIEVIKDHLSYSLGSLKEIEYGQTWVIKDLLHDYSNLVNNQNSEIIEALVILNNYRKKMENENEKTIQ